MRRHALALIIAIIHPKLAAAAGRTRAPTAIYWACASATASTRRLAMEAALVSMAAVAPIQRFVVTFVAVRKKSLLR